MTLRLESYNFYIRLWNYLLPLMAFAMAAVVRFVLIDIGREPSEYDPRFYFAVLLFTTLVWAITVEQWQLCNTDELFREYTGIRKSVSACFATYTALLAVLFFYRQQNFSRVFFIVSAVAQLLLTLGTRIALRRLLHMTRNLRRSVRVLIVGTDQHAHHIASRLAHVPLVASVVVGYLRIGDQKVAVHDAPVYEFGDIGTGRMVLFEEMVIAAAPDQFASLGEVVSRLEKLCVPIRVVLDLGGLPLVRERLFQLGDLQMLDVDTTPLESPAYFFLKRVFDISFSLFMVLLTAPLMMLIVVAIKVSSQGPVLFRQERVGLNGEPFDMLKFRTMRVTHSAESDTKWTVKNDPRRTAVGTFLRKTSLDELPQFFNVLRGDMSVVGPRPERPHFVKRFLAEISHYDSRHRLKVGITGWAQVNGLRGDTSIQKRFEFDLYYLQNWSFWFDLRIIVLTALSGMLGKDAY
ncbi:MAG TPA: undecaprenyl-phosphate glucose phosphotransferase [Terriglobales bacterium]